MSILLLTKDCGSGRKEAASRSADRILAAEERSVRQHSSDITIIDGSSGTANLKHFKVESLGEVARLALSEDLLNFSANLQHALLIGSRVFCSIWRDTLALERIMFANIQNKLEMILDTKLDSITNEIDNMSTQRTRKECENVVDEY